MRRHLATSLLVIAGALGVSGCRQDMHDQQKVEPLEGTPFFTDGRGSRQPVEGTVSRGQLHEDRHYWEGRYAADGTGPAGEPVDSFPMPVTREMLARGRERYDIYCTPCHSRTGDGDGMIVRRGYQRPPTFHSDALRNQKVGHLFEVIGKGLGAMPAYAAQIPVADRWAIVAYLRALQRSQQASIDDVPEADRAKLLAAKDQPAPQAPTAVPTAPAGGAR
jgi:mono/diheme cytochrome c family protein